jgi:hypothetical protein
VPHLENKGREIIKLSVVRELWKKGWSSVACLTCAIKPESNMPVRKKQMPGDGPAAGVSDLDDAKEVQYYSNGKTKYHPSKKTCQ